MLKNLTKSFFIIAGSSKVARWVGATAASGLIIDLSITTGDAEAAYVEMIHSRNLTQHQLGPALVIDGIFLICVGTWFGLTGNLQASIGQRSERSIPIPGVARSVCGIGVFATPSSRSNAHSDAVGYHRRGISRDPAGLLS